MTAPPAPPFEMIIGNQVPGSRHLPLHVLPPHQELIAPLPTGYVGPVMAEAEEWLRVHGYRTLGPWMISWAANGQPQLRRAVSGALRAVRDTKFQTVEMGEQLLVAVPFTGWPILPHNFTLPVSSAGLDVIGAPLLLALGNEPPTMAWVPVVPGGTRGLYPTLNTKLGLQPKTPRAGYEISVGRSWLNALLTITRFALILAIGVIFLIALSLAVLMIVGELPLTNVPLTFVSIVSVFFFGVLSVYLAIPFAIVYMLILIYKVVQIQRWNKFWNRQPPPPNLLLNSRGEGRVGAWLN